MLFAEAAAHLPIVPSDYSVPWFIGYPIAVVMATVIVALFKALLNANGKKSAADVQTEVDHQKRIDRYTELLHEKDEALERCQENRVKGMGTAVTAIVTMNERQKQVLGLLDNLLDRLSTDPRSGGGG